MKGFLTGRNFERDFYFALDFASHPQSDAHPVFLGENALNFFRSIDPA
jgi:hypothetical protein